MVACAAKDQTLLRAMNNDRLFRITNRINLLLLREIGHGVEVRRMFGDPLYARDVLLVCEAFPGTDLASMAQHFRVALAEWQDEQARGSSFGSDSSGFGLSRPSRGFDAGIAPPHHARSWFSPARWIGR